MADAGPPAWVGGGFVEAPCSAAVELRVVYETLPSAQAGSVFCLGVLDATSRAAFCGFSLYLRPPRPLFAYCIERPRFAERSE
jgi:hypothetical protein